MGAVAAEAAFEQSEAGDIERFGNEALAALEEVLGLAAAAAFPPGKRDVRMKGAALRLEADTLAHPLDLGGERGERLLGIEPGPQGASTERLEPADSLHPNRERTRAHPAERCGEVLGD